MNPRALPRVFAWAFLTGFLTDLLRRCLIVEALYIGQYIALGLLFAVWRLRAAWRKARRNRRIDFIRPGVPSWDDLH